MSCETVIIEASGQSPPGPKPSVACSVPLFWGVVGLSSSFGFYAFFFAFQATDGTHTALYTHTHVQWHQMVVIFKVRKNDIDINQKVSHWSKAKIVQ